MTDNTKKGANSDLQNITQKMLYRATRIPLNTQLNWRVRELLL